MKTIGILGGFGPQATMDFEARIHQVAQGLIPQRGNSGYPPMIVCYFRHSPVVMAEHNLPRFPIELDPRLFEAAKQVGTLADFLVITANGLHIFQQQIEEAAGCKVLSMIDVTLAEVQQRQWQKVGVLGLGRPLVYTQPLDDLGIAYEIPSADVQPKLDAAILALMEGKEDAEATAITQEAIETLRAGEIDGIILGCTEIPLLLKEKSEAADLINPAQLLAETAVKYALE